MFMVSNSLFLDILREDLVVLGSGFLFLLVSLLLLFLIDSLSSESLLSNESLNFRGLVESLISLFNFSPHDVLSNIISLSEGEHLSDVVSSLGSKSSWFVTISNSFNLSFSLSCDLEGNDCKIRSADASSYGLSLSLTSSSGSVA